jgi:hypothetical protein
MPVTGTVSKNVNIGGQSSSENQQLSDQISVVASPPTAGVPVAQASTLTAASGQSGTLTMANPSHGITTGQRLDLYWANGQKYGVTSGTVAGTSVPVSGGTGTNLPSTGTGVMAGICVNVPFNLTGSNITLLTAFAPQQGYFVYESGGGDIVGILLGPGVSYNWYAGVGYTNPLLANTVVSVWMSHSNTVTPQTAMQTSALSH